MNSKKIEFIPDGTIVECPHCHVRSMSLTAEEMSAVHTGQQMVDVCQVCGKEVFFNGQDL